MTGGDIIHELDAGDFALHVFDNRDRRLRCSQPGKTDETNHRGKNTFHSGKPRLFLQEALRQ
jgi:hypothetical protein